VKIGGPGQSLASQSPQNAENDPEFRQKLGLNYSINPEN